MSVFDGDLVYNGRKVESLLTKIAERMEFEKVPRNKISGTFGAIIFQDIINHFEKEMGESGRWKQWSPRYAAKRQGGKKLQDEGTLKQAFTPAKWRKNKGGFVWFNPTHYAGIHNKGGTIKHPGSSNGFGKGIKIPSHSITMPKRDFMWLSGRAMEKLASISLKMILETKRGK